MDPLSAVSFASAVIQILIFSAKVITRTREIHLSADGTIEETTILETSITNLDELMADLNDKIFISPLRKSVSGTTLADEQLVHLARDCQHLGADLRRILDSVRKRKDGRDRNAFDQGFRSVVKQRELSRISQKLEQLRKQVDTALLVSLRHKASLIQKIDDRGTIATKESGTKLLDSSLENNWDPTWYSHRLDFSKCLTTSVGMDVEYRFYKIMLDQLWFADLPDRFESIPKAHQDTFRWMFDSNSEYDGDEWDSFTDWLSSSNDNNLFWATGKPGSGKSTLMKFICNDARTSEHLETWTKELPLIKAGFFFWNSGTVMQMSRMGLLRSLLHTILSGDQPTLLYLFKQRLEEFVAFGGGRYPFTWNELRQAFETMLKAPQTPRSFFFMMDGLDEFDGDCKELIDLIRRMAALPYVKVCVASRPLLVYKDAFEACPTLLLERLTRNDIKRYIATQFGTDKNYVELCKLEPEQACSIITEIADKASGVFLWVHLVVQSLLDGLSNADNMSEMVARLEALPPGLEELYDKLLHSLDTNYFKDACQLFRLLMLRRHPTLLHLYFADTSSDGSAMSMEICELTEDRIVRNLDIMQRRLTSRCKGFLEVDNGTKAKLSLHSVVRWIHRTARDFLQAQPTWETILATTGYDRFSPERQWANGFMGSLKSMTLPSNSKLYCFKECIKYCILLEAELGECPTAYIDEFERTANNVCRNNRLSLFSKPNHIAGCPDTPEVRSFLDFAVIYGLAGYIRAKGPTLAREALQHATKFEACSLFEWRGYREGMRAEFDDGGRLTRWDGVVDQAKARKELVNALKRSNKEYRRQRWTKVKKRILG